MTAQETRRVDQGPPILVASFAGERELQRAIAALEASGIARDFVGALIPGAGWPAHPCMTSIMVPRGCREAVENTLRAAALEVGRPAEFQARYGAVPHPGVYEDHDMKLPMGREFPDTRYAPAISGLRTPAASLDPRNRVWTFDEVELGYTPEEAIAEAERCVGCPEPRCRKGCPAGNDIPSFVGALRRQDLPAAVAILRQTSNFPGICGRVCDKARQCEGACIQGTGGGEAVAIGLLERFVADWELREGRRDGIARKAATGKRVAIVGSGPSGLAVADELAGQGHTVTVYESLPVAGGALAWGIPAFRLPPEVVAREIEHLRALGVEFRLGVKIGEKITIDDLLSSGYHAVFVGVGATLSIALGLPGEGLAGIYTATEFLSRTKLSHTHPKEGYLAPVIGERLVVIGAGNTAMDVAQTALRLAAEDEPERVSAQTTMDVAETAARLGFREVTVVYRRSAEEMPARKEEVDSAREEGVRFRFLTSPTRFIGDERGRVKAMECIETAMGKPDKHGRRAPIPKPGTEFVLAADTAVLALGYRPEPLNLKPMVEMPTDRGGLVNADRQTGATRTPGVWAGGDIVTGAATVVQAMTAGRRAAADIDRYLKSGATD